MDSKKEKRAKKRQREDSSLDVSFGDVDANAIDASEELLDVVKHQVEEIEGPEAWPKEDRETLIRNMLKHSTSFANKKFSNLKSLKWENVKFKDYSVEDCKKEWSLIVDRIRKFRSIHEVLQDALKWNEHPWTSHSRKKRHPDLPKKPLTPYLRYFIEKRKKLDEETLKLPPTQVSKLLASQYAKLSEKKRKKYIEAYETEMEEYKQKLAHFRQEHPNVPILNRPNEKFPNCPEKPKSPFDFFKSKQLSKYADDDTRTNKERIEAIRAKWHSLSEKKKVKFIRKAFADEKRYREEVAKYQELYPEFKGNTKSVLSKAEIDIKERFEGKPEKPPASGYALFSKIMMKQVQDVPSKEKMSQIAKRWKELSDHEREEYSLQAKRDMVKYIERLDKYTNSLPEDQRGACIKDLPSIKNLISLSDGDGLTPKKRKKSKKAKEKIEVMEVEKKEASEQSEEANDFE
ncbi:nucleolar transcription factor 1-A-like isoform X2 [Dinothrombium tinctorium]|uniref:Nucleolar transcription factor 1-A-like isoform X2 n=1 Tax=Dinothrombium tinctorium TaxID=1965070 RepID=A0A443RG66_9ACAR|nr:nucleolar transcription factor 1-A-like isoform X2 [Dinothrombium tinctorium]RWS14237.1 nucleolar transcription factor 1-A-like isoform X2 [Dinothrombium tinctorium]RWS15696.1 nucleolar transcription factor 1-A-like isoform X2 [Dinothrombium tinctorium]